MAEPPPPSPERPPPGWYPDPATPGGQRWWDGNAWSEQTKGAGPSVEPSFGGPGQSPAAPAGRYPAAPQAPVPPAAFGFPPPPVRTTSPIRELGPWISESFRLGVDRAGHFLPMVVLFVLSIGLFNSVALWFGLENSTLTIDSDSGEADWVYGGSSTWLMFAALSIPASAILTAMAKAAITRQAWATQAGNPEPWSISVNGAVARSRRVIAVALGRSVIYWVSALFLFLAVALNPGFILLAPIVVIALLGVWVALCFIGQTAALADHEDGAYRTSLRLVRIQLGPLIGRLLLLAMISGSMILAFGLIGAPFTAIVGGGSDTAVEFGAETIRSQDMFGQNVAVFALGSLFSALGLGANHVLTTVGTTLLYRNLGGPVGADAPGSEADGGLTSQTT